MTPDQIEKVFGSLARIEEKVDSTKLWMAKHVEDDKKMAADISLINLRLARQRGFFAAFTSVGSVVGGGIAILVERLLNGH